MLSVNKALSYSRDGIGIGRKGTIDKPYILKAPFWTVDTLFYALCKNSNNLYFTYALFQKVDWREKDESTGVPSLSKTAINNTTTYVAQENEQIKIGNLLLSIDNLITLHQRKYSHKQVKVKISKISNNTTWEQRKLSEISDVRDGTHDSPKYLIEGHPFITSKNVKDGYINYDDIQYISESDFNEINKRSKVDKNDILFGMIGTIGNIALIRENPDFAIKNVALIKDKKNVYYLYLYHYLQSQNILKQFDENKDGGTQQFIALNKIRDLIISLPSKEEQHIIGDYLERLDNLITLHQHK